MTGYELLLRTLGLSYFQTLPRCKTTVIVYIYIYIYSSTSIFFMFTSGMLIKSWLSRGCDVDEKFQSRDTRSAGVYVCDLPSNKNTPLTQLDLSFSFLRVRVFFFFRNDEKAAASDRAVDQLIVQRRLR